MTTKTKTKKEYAEKALRASARDAVALLEELEGADLLPTDEARTARSIVRDLTRALAVLAEDSTDEK